MHLSGTGTFRPVSPVVFVQVAQGLSNCELLERAVRTGPLQRKLDFPYHPHVTVAQDIDDAGLDRAFNGLSDFVARFPVNHFVLFSRDTDSRWHWRTEYLLGGAENTGG
jgi:2'-5' RNA ligase